MNGSSVSMAVFVVLLPVAREHYWCQLPGGGQPLSCGVSTEQLQSGSAAFLNCNKISNLLPLLLRRS